MLRRMLRVGGSSPQRAECIVPRGKTPPLPAGVACAKYSPAGSIAFAAKDFVRRGRARELNRRGLFQNEARAHDLRYRNASSPNAREKAHPSHHQPHRLHPPQGPRARPCRNTAESVIAALLSVAARACGARCTRHDRNKVKATRASSQKYKRGPYPTASEAPEAFALARNRS